MVISILLGILNLFAYTKHILVSKLDWLSIECVSMKDIFYTTTVTVAI